jgi:hypothetical protein
MNQRTISPQRHDKRETNNEQKTVSIPAPLSAAQRLIKAVRPSHYSLFITHCGAAAGAGVVGGLTVNGYA